MSVSVSSRWRSPSRQALAGLACALLLLGAASCGDDMPYSYEELLDAQSTCQAQKMAFGTEDLECLRDELPELSDDQLNRLDHLIEEAEEEEFGS